MTRAQLVSACPRTCLAAFVRFAGRAWLFEAQRIFSLAKGSEPHQAFAGASALGVRRQPRRGAVAAFLGPGLQDKDRERLRQRLAVTNLDGARSEDNGAVALLDSARKTNLQGLALRECPSRRVTPEGLSWSGASQSGDGAPAGLTPHSKGWRFVNVPFLFIPLLRLADSSHIGVAFLAERQAHVDESAYRGAGLAVRQDGLDVS